MGDLDLIPEPPAAQGGDTTLSLFLALYLLVLAFFILLVSISSVEDVKTSAVRDSLTSTFATVLPTSADLTVFQAKEGEVMAGQRFQEEVTGIFATQLQIAKVEVVQPGKLMRVVFPSDSLFFAGEIRIREASVPLLDRIVASISSRPPGMRFDLQFVIGAKYALDNTLAIGETLEMRRAGAFARELLSRGAPPDSISVGMEPGDPGEIVIWFHTLAEDEGRVSFEPAPGEGS